MQITIEGQMKIQSRQFKHVEKCLKAFQTFGLKMQCDGVHHALGRGAGITASTQHQVTK